MTKRPMIMGLADIGRYNVLGVKIKNKQVSESDYIMPWPMFTGVGQRYAKLNIDNFYNELYTVLADI